MSKLALSCLVVCAVLMPQVGSAQVFPQQNPPVITDPATASRQAAGEPIYFDGQFYYPTGPITFFDPNVMVRTGTYQGVAVFSNSTQEPWSIIYLPIGGTSLRPYERIRNGELGGTTGSRTPSFPVQPPVNSPWLSAIGGPIISTAGSPAYEGPAPAAAAPAAEPPRHVSIMMIPAPTGDSGLWVEFNSTRWYHEGDSVTLEKDKFDQIGTYKDFSVYKQKGADDRTIFVPTQRDGTTLARYVKR
jgi:hypothetical protein